jgi:hypothetical protein
MDGPGTVIYFMFKINYCRFREKMISDIDYAAGLL